MTAHALTYQQTTPGPIDANGRPTPGRGKLVCDQGDFETVEGSWGGHEWKIIERDHNLVVQRKIISDILRGLLDLISGMPGGTTPAAQAKIALLQTTLDGLIY